MLRVTKEDVRSAYRYYGLFYRHDLVFHTAYILKTDSAGEDVLCFGKERREWYWMDRAGFDKLRAREEGNDSFSELDEQMMLWYLEMNEAFNGEGDDAAVEALLAKWTEKKEEFRAAFNYGWPAKLVKTTFYLKGKAYTITPESIGLGDDSWEEGFMEFLQGDIGADLKALGATEIRHHGFID